MQAFDALRQNDPAVREGWASFDGRVRKAALDERHVLEAKRAELLQAHALKSSYTYPNFLRLMAREASQFAFHHRVTGCAGSAEAARLLLGWLMDFPVWNAQAPQNGWRTDLWTADFAAAAGFALDALDGSLDSATRDAWRRIVLERGVIPVLEEWLDPDRRIHALDTMGHNWWAVCVGGATLGLFAACDEPAAKADLFTRVADGIVEFFRYPGNRQQHKQRTFGEQGDFIESAGYLDYTLHSLCPLFDLYRAHLGRDLPAELPALARIPDYYLALVQPLREGVRRLNFGDMGSGADTVGSYAHQPAATWMWLAGEFAREDLFHLVRRTHARPAELLEFLFWPVKLRGMDFTGAPGDVVFESIGVAVLRDGYADDATVLAVKTGEIWNHNQSDAGSIILSAAGVPCLIDPGTTEYSHPLHAGWFKTAHAHNVTLCDERGPRGDLDLLGTPYPGRIRDRLLAPGYRYVLADATGPWEGLYRRYLRHLIWTDGFVASVEDLMADRAETFTSLFHFEGEADAAGNRITLRCGGSAFVTHLVSPGPIAIESRAGHTSRVLANPFKYEYGRGAARYFAARYRAPAGCPVREKLIHIHALPDGGVTAVEPIAGEALTGARITARGGTWTLLCNHNADGRVMHLNARLAWREYETDGFLLLVRLDADGKPDRIALHNGSYVRVGGRTIYSALLKSDALWERTGRDAILHAHLSAPARVDVANAASSLQSRPLPAGGSSVSLSADSR